MKNSQCKRLLTITLSLLIIITAIGLCPIQLQAAETFTTIVSGLNNPMSIAVDSSGRIYYTDKTGVYRVDADGSNKLTLANDSVWYYGIAVNDQYVFYSDLASDSVFRTDLDGNSKILLGTYPTFSEPAGLSLDSSGRVYVASTYQNCIRRINDDGTGLTTLGSGLSYPNQGVVYDDTYIYVVDSGHNAVKRMTIDGTDIIVLGSGFNIPMGLAVDSSGNIYVADTGNNQVKKMDPTGTTIVNVGTGYDVWGVCVDSNDNLYIADCDTNSIIKVSNSVTKLEQTAPAAPTVAGRTATSITLNTITGAEYRLDSGTWQASPVFTGLSPNTEYEFYARLAETATLLPSPASAVSEVTTDRLPAPATPVPPTLGSKSATSVTLNSISGAEYRMGSGAWQTSPVFSGLAPNTEYTFFTRTAQTSTTYASAESTGLAVSTDKSPAPAAPVAPVLGSKTTTSVTLASVAGAEYRMGSGAWQTSPVFSNLQPGMTYTFTIRLAETQTALASAESQTLSVTTFLTDPEIPVTGERDGQMLFGLLLFGFAAVIITLKLHLKKQNEI